MRWVSWGAVGTTADGVLEFRKKIGVNLVHLVVHGADVACERGIGVHERIEAHPEHGLDLARHDRKVGHDLVPLESREAGGTFGDVHREVAQAFKVVVDLEHRDDEPEIVRTGW